MPGRARAVRAWPRRASPRATRRHSTTRRAEVEHALRMLARGDDPTKVLEILSQGLTNKLLHAPTQLLSHADVDERSKLAQMIERIYQLKPLD